ncbi:hypothetical protein SAMN04487785_11623 [Dyella jiangningensis]|uniref:hypothetical protein n=1 Tax=Dyella sp. AtDHG13 TaxID=1938897 RepID=UPI0008806012|nr:hypothetical protein [Dyella sp. AtDHG13]PXV53690.1 hypothetical protein BDW41_11498 [Dyella sp. AtDHG13]SDL21198.1 hypothetical protein SAMN04487785_11623 [Dyella jiangningensis]
MLTQKFAEVLLLFPAAMAAGFMLFVADVVQSTMDDMEAAEFKRFLASLVAHATRSPVAILANTITFVGMFPYWYFYGFNNLWFTAGLILWVITSAISKQMSLPIYSRVTGRKFPAYKARIEIDAADAAALEKERRKLRRANLVRGALALASVAAMVIGLA